MIALPGMAHRLGFITGTYSIKICAPEMDSPFDIQESVQHEAIHLAQWCRGAQSVYNISSLKSEGRKNGFTADVDYAHKMASEHYDKSEYDSI